MIKMSLSHHNRIQPNKLPHILIVDSMAFSDTQVESALRTHYHLVAANNGQAALDIVKNQPFDMVLLNIVMPDMDGLAILQAIRSHPQIANLPVILLAQKDEVEQVAQGLQLGANDYLVKPVDVQVLSTRVKTQIRLKQLLDERKRTTVEIATMQQMKDRLMQIASHDLKAPLANIRMAEYILRDFVGDDPSGNQILDTMLITIDNMQSVIEDFLDAAAIQNGNIRINLQFAPVVSLVQSVLQQYFAAATHKEIELEIGNLPGEIRADKARFDQILGNLISNALKYSPKRTVVTIWADHLGDFVRINVADQGPGIPVEERHLLFQEFGSLSTRPTGNESSSGLGLWGVKELMTLHKGRVGADFPADGGSIFWVDFPAKGLQ